MATEINHPDNLVYAKPALMNDTTMHYCPGCSHGVVHKLIAEVVAEMGMEEKTVGICPVGCAVFAYRYLDIDWQEAPHGRAPALAAAVKRLWNDRLVFTYQGDGDLACIGTCETIHSLNRGDNIVIIFVNNAIYGMTGGQMSATTLLDQPTATCPSGRPAAAWLPARHHRPCHKASRHVLCHPSERRHGGLYQQGQACHAKSFRSFHGRKGLFPDRNRLYL